MNDDANLLLNVDQQRAFDTVLDAVDNPNKEIPLVLFICGPAGTGKSVLIRRLVSTVGEQHVIVSATTGMAGKNVGGKTIHSILNLDPYSDELDDAPVYPHPYLKLWIVDEISMCDRALFERGEKRMRRLKRNNRPFGLCTVVLFGDLLQIPPVRGEWIFRSQLWQDLVQYEELEINMRQENDPEFGNMLKRWRLGRYTHADRVFLDERVNEIPEEGVDASVSFFLEQYRPELAIMILAYTNKRIGVFNEKITYKLFDKETELYDVTRDLHTKHDKQRYPTIEHQLMFLVGNGGRVMITSNTHDDMVNGDIGIVSEIQSHDDTVTGLNVTLFSDGSTKPLSQATKNLPAPDNVQKWGVGFPIIPAYAVTYHKAQGQTLDKVFLLALDNLPPALFYVGASRVRTRDDLYILNTGAADTICADADALKEYKRLRTSIGKTPLPIV